MSDIESNEASEKNVDQQIVKFIFDLSKEMNIEDTRGVVGNELELIALVRNCRFLYDKSLTDFKDIRKKNVAWGAIASVMHSRVHEVQQRWRSLREGYNKYKKELEALDEINNANIRPWEFYEDMKFIDPYIIHRRDPVNISDDLCICTGICISQLKPNWQPLGVALAVSRTNVRFTAVFPIPVLIRSAFSSASGGNFTGEMESLKDETADNSSERNTDVMQLITNIQVRPVLYDSKHPNYKSRENKIQAWNEVAQAIGAAASECEAKWKNLRERYGRERKLKGLHGDKKLWPYFDVLSFLDAHIKPRRHSIFRPILPKLAVEDTNNIALLNSLHTPARNHSTIILKQVIKDASDSTQNTEIPAGAKLKLPSNIDVQHVEFVDASHAMTSRSPSVTPTPSESKLNFKGAYLSPSSEHSQISHDEDELFGQTITAELRRMPSGKKKMKIKAEIYKILYENESDN